MHRYRVDGVEHIANAQDPQIPAALAGVVGGVVTLNDFRRTSHDRLADIARVEVGILRGAGILRRQHAQYLSGGFRHDLRPEPALQRGDQRLRRDDCHCGAQQHQPQRRRDVPLHRGPRGQHAAVLWTEPIRDWCPAIRSESTLDVEWSGAVAPAAAVNLVVAASTQTTDGMDLASAYIVNHATAPVVSVSYGSCEQEMGAAELAFYNSLWEQAASQGMSVFVASGDAGAAGCKQGTATAGTADAVNGLCSSPYATCVGGTEFNEGANAAQYWSAANSAGYGSALGYIPEEVWNESALDGGTGLWASGGGASTVYAQPAWQAEASGTAAAGGMRAVPDVSLSAADHDGYFVVENGAYLGCLRHFGGGAVVCRHHGPGCRKGRRQRPGQRESAPLCAGCQRFPIHFIARRPATTAFQP